MHNRHDYPPVRTLIRRDDEDFCPCCSMKFPPRYPEALPYGEAVFGPFGRRCHCAHAWR